jgi:hypothetical protein
MHISRKWIGAAVLAVLAFAAGCAWLGAHWAVRVQFDQDVPVTLRGSVPLHTTIERPIEVSINKEIEAKVNLGAFSIDLDERVEIPLHMNVQVPIDSEMRIDQPLDLALDVPIDTVLTEKELDLNQLSIPIDQHVFIDDTLDIDVVVPIDTTVTTTLGMRVPVKTNLPVKMKVPIKQRLHVRDTLKLKLSNVRVPLKMLVPVRMQVPLKQSFRVRGTIAAPIDQTVIVPIRKKIQPAISTDLPVTVRLSGKLPASVKAKFDASVVIDDAIQTRLGPIQISAKDVTLRFGTRPKSAPIR